MTRAARHAIARNPPPGWGRLFAPVPGRSAKVRCLLCGQSGYGACGPHATGRPSPWQTSCLLGHPARCATCGRPFVSGGALAGHQRCKSHHACCLHHTTVAPWKRWPALPARIRGQETANP